MALTDSIEHKLDRGLSDIRRTGRRVDARRARPPATCMTTSPTICAGWSTNWKIC